MRLNTLVLIFILFALTTCKKDHMFDCLKSAGETTTETRTASAFTEMNIKDNVDVILYPNSSPFIRVTAGENIIDGIITEISGNTLYIRNENRCNWMRSFKNTYTVEVGIDKPAFIHYQGSGDVNCMDTIRTDDFTFDCVSSTGTANLLLHCQQVHIRNITGRADVHITGFCNLNYIILSDVGIIDGSKYDTDFSYISSNSTGDCRIRVKNELDYEIQYTGNILYTGEPKIIGERITGSGKLIHY